MFMRLRKRKLNQIPNENKKKNSFRKSKKVKYISDIDDSWVSASSIINYMMDDPIIDYFNMKESRFSTSSKTKIKEKILSTNNSNTDFSDILIMQGNIFEQIVIKFLKQRITNNYRNFITIAHNRDDIKNKEKYKETIDAINKGVPFIYQAVLHDNTEKIYGSPDLLVRNDFMKLICDNFPSEFIHKPESASLHLTESVSFRLAERALQYYYFVIDIKSSTLHLRSNGNHLLNQGRLVGYKGQIYIYHKILSKIQKYDSQKAFILGKGYKYNSCGISYVGLGWFDKLGCIDYTEIDKKIIEKTIKAINWRRNVQLNHNKMKLYPLPSNINLYPNMCNKLDNKYRAQKQKLATHLSEHTLISWVSVKHRKNAHAKSIYKYNDNKCTINALGITGNKIRKRVEILLNANHVKNKKIFVPKNIKFDEGNWRNSFVREAYVDFETIPYVLIEDYSTKIKPVTDNCTRLLYLIGVWYIPVIKSKKTVSSCAQEWKYKYFLADKLNKSSEKNIVAQFTNFINDLNIKRLFHWGISAEPAIYKSMINQYRIPNSLSNDIWYDMCTLFIKGNVGVKGSTSYGLKNIANAMYKHNMIDQIWNSKDSEQDIDNIFSKSNLCSTIDNGFESILLIYNINKKMINNNLNKLCYVNEVNNILQYNLMDCKILHKIMKYIRKNH